MSGGREIRDIRKTEQLCRQVERRLSLVFAGELEDPILVGLVICSVTAIAGPSLLKVEVQLPSESDGVHRDAAIVLKKLAAATQWLRSEIAGAISRKRTPQIIFSLASSDHWDHCEN